MAKGLTISNVFNLNKPLVLNIDKMKKQIPVLQKRLVMPVTLSNVIFNQLSLAAWFTNADAFMELCRFYEDYVIPASATDIDVKKLLEYFVQLSLTRPIDDLSTVFINRDYIRLLFKTVLITPLDAALNYLNRQPLIESDNLINSIELNLPIVLAKQDKTIDFNGTWNVSAIVTDTNTVYTDDGFHGITPGTIEMVRFFVAGTNNNVAIRILRALEKISKRLLHPTVALNYAANFAYWPNSAVVPTEPNAGYGVAIVPSLGYLRCNFETCQFTAKAFKNLRPLATDELALFGRLIITSSGKVLNDRAGCFDVQLQANHQLIDTQSAVFVHGSVGLFYQKYNIPSLVPVSVTETITVDYSSKIIKQSVIINNLSTVDIGFRDLNSRPHTIKSSGTCTIKSAFDVGTFAAIDYSDNCDYAFSDDDNGETIVLLYKKEPFACWPKKDFYIPAIYSFTVKQRLYSFAFDSTTNQLCNQN